MKIKESEKRDKYLDLARKLKKKKTIADDGEGDTNWNWCTGNKPQRIGKGTWRLRNQRTIRDHPEYSILRAAKILRRILET